MATQKKSGTDKRTQSQKFIDKAREIGANGDEAAFLRAIKTVATAPVSKAKKNSKR